MFMPSHQNTERNNKKTTNESLENVKKFKYLETTAENQNCIHEDTESTLN
jgi:hypothetical protein